MLTVNAQQLETAQQACVERWCSPCPGFTSGRDIRTSDNGLLVLLYGSLAKAAHYEWLNAGRSLVDKTYLRMLQAAQGLAHLRQWNAELIARNLDEFIRSSIQPVWHELPDMDEQQKTELVCLWVEQAGAGLFGSLHHEGAASKLLFFLCPQLPVLNTSTAIGYRGFHQVVHEQYRQRKPELDKLQYPEPFYGERAEQSLVSDVLRQTDWWQRRVFSSVFDTWQPEEGR